MLSYKQNELIKLFIKNILNNDPLNSTTQKIPNNVNRKISNRIYKKIITKLKYKPILGELIEDYFSNIDKSNKDIENELPYIIQILALLNNSIGFIADDKLSSA